MFSGKLLIMSTKTYIYMGLTIGSLVGSWIGSFFDHGNFLGFWGFFLGTVGAFIGIWGGFKLGNM